ncbi:MAG TPA: tetratricopeptide repeat protein [Candidatus Polarisedimenticolaceae bacterium]|nr:tetratricopeptide repeat protein [Candidatus Polarisedimenticolaceae bacterium]
MQGYSAKDVARMLDLSVAQVRSFVKAGFIEPRRGERGEYRFSFQDLVLLRTAKGLRAANVPPRRLVAVLRRLKQQLPEGRPLSAVQIQARGDQVVIRRDGTLWDAESGQASFDFDVAELAEKAAPHAARVFERARSAPGALSVEDWFELGFELEAAAPDQARQAYLEALERRPSHVDARINLGRLLQLVGDLHLAEAHFRIALSYEPSNATALFNLGVALEDLGRVGEARRAYGEAIAADETFADAHYNLARLFEQTGDSQAALRHLKIYRRLTESS